MDAAWARRLVGVALAGFLIAGSGEGGSAVADAYGANASLRSYTFTMHGTMAMHTFPWLRIPISGQGLYDRGRVYDVHLAGIPFFAKGFGRIDLSALAPQMWRPKFDVSYAGSQDGADIYTLRDPRDAALRSETVWVDPVHGIREVLLLYDNGGRVDLHVQCAMRDGYLVPAATDAQIDVPHAKLSVTARFGDYHMTAGRSLVGSAHTR